MEGNSFREAAAREALVRLLVFMLSSLLFPLPRRPKVGSGPQKLPHPPVPQCRLQHVTHNPRDVNYSAQRLCIVSTFHPGAVRCDVNEPPRRRGPDLRALQLRTKASRLHPGSLVPASCLCLRASPSLSNGLPVQCCQCWTLGSCLRLLPSFLVHHRGNPALQISLLIQTPKPQAVQCKAPQQTALGVWSCVTQHACWLQPALVQALRSSCHRRARASHPPQIWCPPNPRCCPERLSPLRKTKLMLDVFAFLLNASQM